MRLALLLTLMLASCVNPRVVMVNDRGQEKYCEGYGYGVVGGIMAHNRYTDCVNQAGKEGYKPRELNSGSPAQVSPTAPGPSLPQPCAIKQGPGCTN